MSVPIQIWIALLVGVLAMLGVDLFFHRSAHEVRLREAAVWSAVWVALGALVGLAIWWGYGQEFGLQYFAGYLIEKSLAVDNVFLWAVLLGFFAVPAKYQHRVLFYGVVGAIAFRAIMIAAGSVLISAFSWVLYLFGAFLIVTGIRMLRSGDDHVDPERSRILRVFRRIVPTTDELDGQKFLTRRTGRLVATPLLVALVVIELTDVLFALDSIPAIFAVTEEPFLLFSSNVMAILGLRALYFLLASVMDRFVYLKFGLSLVLTWVGIKMIISHAWTPIPTALSLGIIAFILSVAVGASLYATRASRTGNWEDRVET